MILGPASLPEDLPRERVEYDLPHDQKVCPCCHGQMHRMGEAVPISRGALAHWVIGSSEKHLHRIYDALKLWLRSQPLIHGDETTVQVLKEDKEAISASYMWACRSGEDSDEPIVLLDYQPGRGQIGPQAFLGNYRGILMSDGYTAWRTLDDATHVGCMAPLRRRS
ncbi:Hypothetical protein NGAL_HAMBI2566_60920 [Neorhizobium galegae bv. orientalis]|nr:Hypothetical protein NGAL_HAMBI2566_60920 [Neorhizobium galegae bv. orientalis]